MTFAHNKFAVFLFLLVGIYPFSVSAQEAKPLEAGVVKITSEVSGKIGTGFIVQLTRDIAYIVTASHVVEGEQEPKIEFFTQRNIPVAASVVGLEGGDPRGLAILLVRGEENLPSGLSALPLSPSVHLKSGDEITVIGFPRLAGPWSVIKGSIVSRRGRDIFFDGTIDEGNSGGPMMREGQVAGLVTGLSGPYGCAIPAVSVQLFLEGWGIETTQLLEQLPTATPIPLPPATPTPLPTTTPTPLPPATPTPLPTTTPTLLSTLAAGQKRHDSVSGIDFVWIPVGCFQMGQTETDKRYLLEVFNEEDYKKYFADELPRHEVCVDGFWMGKTEVTQAQWKRIMGNNPSNFKGDTHPVEQVSWNKVQEFLQKLNEQAGNPPLPLPGGEFRLPTEAEWEYAARAGTNTMFYFGDNVAGLSKYAWYSDNSDGKTHPVGQLKPNVWGLYDIHGNVWEWCQDWYESEYYSKSPSKNPQGPSSGTYRVLRGGSWSVDPPYCRSALRYWNNPGSWYNYVGFRVVVGVVAWTQ